MNTVCITHAIETSTTTIHFVLKVNVRAGKIVEDFFLSASIYSIFIRI